ncbi:MAG TPA: hypothetical protein VL137_03220 [Polyangiaceae bacterium]|nr:hypothetical protein [Polyangiaceae bacterium]
MTDRGNAESERPGALILGAQELGRDVVEDARDWCNEREGWILRSVLLAYLVYGGARPFFDRNYHNAFGGITFGLHELGHIVFLWAGQWVSVAGGSFLQWMAPILAAWHLLGWQRDYFGACVCTCWLGFSLQDSAPYIADARAQALPLISFSNDPLHDWHYLLNSMNLLNWDLFIAHCATAVGIALWLAGCAVGGWLCWQIRLQRVQESGKG